MSVRAFLIIALPLLLAACSTTTSPSRQGPVCGDPIDGAGVLVVDVSAMADDPQRVADFLAEKAGPYRLVTQEPIGLLVDDWRRVQMRSVSSPRGEAAARGCDLLVVLGEEIGQYESVVNGADEGRKRRIQVAHLGTRENAEVDGD